MGEAAMSRAPARPFGFERVFAANDPCMPGRSPDLRGQLGSLQAELVRLEADRDAALRAARIDGFEAGLSQARGEISSALLAASIQVADTVGELAAHFVDTEARISAAAGELALAAAETLAARAIDDNPLAAVSDAIGRLLAQVGTREELRVHVHPTLSVALKAMIAAREPTGARPLAVVVVADDGIVPGDARIAWERGGLALDAAVRKAAVHAELAMLLPAVKA